MRRSWLLRCSLNFCKKVLLFLYNVSVHIFDVSVLLLFIWISNSKVKVNNQTLGSLLSESCNAFLPFTLVTKAPSNCWMQFSISSSLPLSVITFGAAKSKDTHKFKSCSLCYLRVGVVCGAHTTHTAAHSPPTLNLTGHCQASVIKFKSYHFEIHKLIVFLFMQPS